MPDPSAADPNQSPSPDPSQSLAAPPDTCPSITPRGLLGEGSQGGGQGGAKEWSTGSPDLGGHHCGRDPNTCRKPLPNAVPRKRISLKGPSRHTHESCATGPRQPAARDLKVKSSIERFQGDKSFLSSSGVLTYDQLWSPQTDIFGNLCTPSVPAVIHDEPTQDSDPADPIDPFDAPTSPRIESPVPGTSTEKSEIRQMSVSSICTHGHDASLLSTLPSIEEAGTRSILPAATSVSHRFFAARSRLKPERKQDSLDRRMAEERKKRSLARRQLSSKQHA